MNKQEQIEEMGKIIDELYNVYDTTAGDIAEGIYNAGYRKADVAEIERLKADNERFENNMRAVLEIEKKQAKIDVLNELKAKSYVNDYCREVVEIDKIDELLKEYEK